MKWSFLLFSSFLCLQAIAQYPATGNKARLGWQTTGDGLVYRGAIGDTATLDPSSINNAWMLLDTANGNLYAYRAKAWRLVSGGGGSVSDTLTGEVKGPLDSTYIDTVANIIFTTTTDTTVGVGELKYNDTQGSLIQGLKGGNVTNVIGQQIHQRVTNATGGTLNKGTAVFLHGSQGNRITVRKALATVDNTSANTFGIVAESIANDQSGYVITEGLITNMNTNALTEGAAVYLSPTIAGELTTTKPQAPQHTVYIGVCVKQNAGSGELFVKIRNGQELDELHDVRIDSPVSNASLYYNAAQGVWRDTTGAVLTSDTSVFARDFQISGTTNRLAMFTGSNTVGNSWFSQSDSVMTLNDTKKMQLYGRNGRRNYLEIFRGGTNIMQTNYVLATDTAYTASTGTTSRVYTHAVDNQNADYMISTYSGGGTGGYILLDAARTAVGLNNPVNRLDVEGAAAIGATYAGGFVAPTNGLLVEGNVGIGTASPGSYLLNLRDSIGFSGNGMYFSSTNGGTANPGGHIIGTKRGSWGTRIDFVARDAAGSLTETVMSIDGEGGSGGNVGINTSSPSRPLHVAGTTAIRIPVGNFAQRGTSDNGDIRVRTDTASMEYYSGAWRTVAPMARVPQSALANRFSKFNADGLLDTSAILIQANNRIGIFNSPAAGDSALTVTGGIRATRDMYARRYNVNTFGNEILSINNYAPANMINGRNVWIGDGGQASQHTGGQTGGYNVSLGAEALKSNTTGFGNIAVASQALSSNTTGVANVAVGGAALSQNLTTSYNTAVGANALQNSKSDANTAIGASALNAYNQSTGDSGGNVGIGASSLSAKTTGDFDIAIGYQAGAFISTTGGTPLTNSNKNIFIGTRTYPNGNGQTGQIVIGHGAVGNGSNTTTIGNSSTTNTVIPAGSLTVDVMRRKAPVTVTGNHTVAASTSWLICNGTGPIALTLPAAASWTGREIMVKTIQPQAVNSAANDVVPIDGVATGAGILPATDGAWCTLVSDGTNWIIMQRGN